MISNGMKIVNCLSRVVSRGLSRVVSREKLKIAARRGRAVLAKLHALLLVCVMLVSTFSSLLMFPQTAHAVVALSQTDTDSSITNLTTYTFSSASFGAADADRYVIVAGGGITEGSRTVSSVTIGGVSATISQQVQDGFPVSLAFIAIAAVPTGTTGDVVVTFSSTMGEAAISVYRAVGIASITAYDTGSDTTDPMTTTIDIPAGGFAVAVSSVACGSLTTWTGLTEDVDFSYGDLCGANTSFLSSASDTFVSAQTGLTVTSDLSAGEGLDAMVVASWEEEAPPPDAPTALTTTSSTGSVDLSWTAPADDGGSNLETYGVWRATSPFTETSSATLITSFATSTGTTYSDTTASHGTIYYYSVTATNQAATSTLSNQRSSGPNSGRVIRLGGML